VLFLGMCFVGIRDWRRAYDPSYRAQTEVVRT
jgi:hypothetical protein